METNKTKLIEDNMNLVYSVIHKYYPRYISDEDIIQIGMLGLCEAVNAWDAEKGALTTYAWHKIRGAIGSELRTRKKHASVLSLDYETETDDGTTQTLADFVVGEKDVFFIDEPVKKLTVTQQRIFDLLKQGKTAKEISQTLGLTTQCVYRTQRKLRMLRNK